MATREGALIVSGHPLDSFPLVRTSSVEELECSLARIIARPVLKLVSRERPLRAIQNNCQLQHFWLNYGQYGTEVQFRFPEPTIVSQLIALAGKADVLIDGTPVTVSADQCAIVSADSSFGMSCDAEYARLTLNVRAETLQDQLAAMTGQSLQAPLRMNPAQDYRQPRSQLFRRNVMFFVDQLSRRTPLPPLVQAEFEQLLLAMFLCANRHNYSHLLERPAAQAAPQQVRRAEEYIEANWNKPVSLEGLAAAAGVSAQSLFQTFTRSRGCAPLEFLKQVRLRHARKQLKHPGEATTVSDTAAACGFGDVGRFCQDYRQAFGEDPSETLAHGKDGRPTRH